MLPAFAEVAANPDATLDVVALALAAEFRERRRGRRDRDAGCPRSRPRTRRGAERRNAGGAGARVCADARRRTRFRRRPGAIRRSPQLDARHRSDATPRVADPAVRRLHRSRPPGGDRARRGRPARAFRRRPLRRPSRRCCSIPSPAAPRWRTDLVGDQTRPRPWHAHEIAMRMLNNLVAAYKRRGDLGAAIHAATLRLELPTRDRPPRRVAGRIASDAGTS